MHTNVRMAVVTPGRGRPLIGCREAEGPISADENKALVRRFYEEVWDRGNSDFAYEVVADDYIRHDLRPTEALPGAEGQKRIAGTTFVRRSRIFESRLI